jgi:formiminotetrahydrofolate cyclodeaminase
MAKDTEDEKLARAQAVQAALVLATEAPMDCARLSARVIALSEPVAERGNPNVISDAGVAVMAGWAALKSAALNVYVNAGVMKDRAFAEARLAELSALVATAEPAVNRIYERVRSRL